MIFFLIVPFLMLGCAAFLVCAAIPPLQRFALGSALWFAACAPFLLGVTFVVILIMGGLDALRLYLHFPANSFIFGVSQPSWRSLLGLIGTTVIMVTGATLITMIHGVILRRFTLALFRLYLAAVSFGVGLLSFAFVLLALGFALGSRGMDIPQLHTPVLWAPAPLFAAGLAYACFVYASRFRGAYPQRFPVVTREEFHQA